MKYTFILLTFLLLLPSCGKKRSIHIHAVNAATGEVYGGLEYIILSSRTTANGEKFRTEASGLLSATGEAIEEVKVKGNRTYKVRVTAPPNNCYNKEVEQYFESKYDQNGKFTFEFAPCAKLRLSVHNQNCIDESDQIVFRRNWLTINETNVFLTRTGCFQFEGDFFQLPIGDYIYEWDVTKNGVTTSYDSVFVLVENQVFDFTINY